MVWKLYMNMAVIFQIEFLELKIIITNQKNVQDELNRKLKNIEKCSVKLKKKTDQWKWSREQRTQVGQCLLSLKDSWDSIKQPSIHVVRAPEEEEKEKGTQKCCRAIDWITTMLTKYNNVQLSEFQQTQLLEKVQRKPQLHASESNY